jgi:hypothetical protein
MNNFNGNEKKSPRNSNLDISKKTKLKTNNAHPKPYINIYHKS